MPRKARRAVRRPCQKAWRIVRKDFRERARHIVREHVLVNAIPYVEQETSSGLEDPLCVTVARLAVGEEHDAKPTPTTIEGAAAMLVWFEGDLGDAAAEPLYKEVVPVV